MSYCGAKIIKGLVSLKGLMAAYVLLKIFVRDAADPAKTQKRILNEILKRNLNTDFGKKYRFDAIANVNDFIQRVPVHGYEELRPYIERQVDLGEYCIVPEKPLMYAQTSGTTGKPKYIPILERTIASYRRAQHIFAYQQYRTIPGIFSGKLLAIVSPAVEGYLSNGSSYGSMSGMVYQTMPENILSKYVLPPEIFEMTDYESKYCLMSAFSLREKSISCIATANPSTLIKLAEIISRKSSSLIEFVATGNIDVLGIAINDVQKRLLSKYCSSDLGRARDLESIKKNTGGLRFSDIWQDLKGVVTWTSGNCSLVLPKLMQQLSLNTKIIEMGYLSSEFRGTITINCLRNLGVPTIQDNFFEFAEVDSWDGGNRNTLLLSALEQGKSYYIIVTTPHGLYRYFINDIVEVTGFFKNTPTIAFLQKGKGVTNLTGEKLYESQVVQAVMHAAKIHRFDPVFFMMLADQKTFSYRLYIESVDGFDVPGFTQLLNDRLGVLNIEYLSKAQSGRIQFADVKRLKPGTVEIYKTACVQSGQREAQFKVVKLQYRADVLFPFEEHIEMPVP